MTATVRRNIIELAEIGEDVTDISEMRRIMNENIVEINFILRNLTLSNLDGEVVTSIIPASGTVKIPHKLRILPKYRILLKQTGGGVITDVNFTETYIELSNSGGSDASVILFIVKD